MPRKAQSPNKGYAKNQQRSNEDFLDFDEDAAQAMSQQEAMEALAFQGRSTRRAASSDEYFSYD